MLRPLTSPTFLRFETTVTMTLGSFLLLGDKGISHLYPIDFKIQEGGKQENPDELTQVSDSGKRLQPTHLQLER